MTWTCTFLSLIVCICNYSQDAPPLTPEQEMRHLAFAREQIDSYLQHYGVEDAERLRLIEHWLDMPTFTTGKLWPRRLLSLSYSKTDYVVCFSHDGRWPGALSFRETAAKSLLEVIGERSQAMEVEEALDAVKGLEKRLLGAAGRFVYSHEAGKEAKGDAELKIRAQQLYMDTELPIRRGVRTFSLHRATGLIVYINDLSFNDIPDLGMPQIDLEAATKRVDQWAAEFFPDARRQTEHTLLCVTNQLLCRNMYSGNPKDLFYDRTWRIVWLIRQRLVWQNSGIRRTHTLAVDAKSGELISDSAQHVFD